MSIGGKVIEVVRVDERLWVNTVDSSREECAIYVPSAFSVGVGDKVWWQGSTAFWTRPEEGKERKIPRIGFSGVPRPSEERK